MSDVIRRKIEQSRLAQSDGAPGVDRGWRLALARAARETMGLDLDVRSIAIARAGLAEILDVAPDHALVVLLDGPQGGLGVLMLSPSVTAGFIEMQALGRLQKQTAPLRKPTRIDAAMVAGVIDRALSGLDEALAGEADRVWAGGFRYASWLEDVRPLGLMLEEDAYRLLTAEVALADSGRTGRVLLVLPDEGRGTPPARPSADAERVAPPFGAALSAQVMQCDCRLDAVVGRIKLSIGQIMAMTPGEVLKLTAAAIDNVALETLDGRRVARARLGQNQGMRAIKILSTDQVPRTTAPSTPPSPADAPDTADPAPPEGWRAAG
jgi:flagellar motor switch protein FliM